MEVRLPNSEQQINREQIVKYEDKNEQIARELAIKLNDSFQAGDVLDKHKELLQKINKPILVDFNNVLVNNSSELKPNPQAKEFITELEQIGQMIVITTATNWNLVHESLVKFDLWTDKMILLTTKNFYPDHEYGFDEDSTADEYGVNQDDFFILRQRMTDSAPAHKRVGEVFGKDFDIPLIDDTGIATTDNPHIYGIHVEPWFTEEEYKYKSYKYLKSLIEDGKFDLNKKEQLVTLELGLSGETLKNAVEEVKKIYGAVNTDNK